MWYMIIDRMMLRERQIMNNTIISLLRFWNYPKEEETTCSNGGDAKEPEMRLLVIPSAIKNASVH